MEDCEDVGSETDSNVSQQNKNKSTGEAGKPDKTQTSLPFETRNSNALEFVSCNIQEPTADAQGSTQLH